MRKPPPPTLEQFAAYQAAYSYFNDQLFANKLHPCLLNFSRHRGSKGFFSPNRWQREDEVKVHEISLNPDLLNRPPRESMSTLVHEMVHQWQQDEGTPPRSGYHDLQWAAMMEQVGLIPTSTGEPGGKRTGQSMTHLIEEGGEFDLAFSRMPREALLPWQSFGNDKEKKPLPVSKKIKLTCPECKMAVWILATNLGREVECCDCYEQFLTKDQLKERRDEEAA